jgi:hypothetical protein
VSSSRMFECCDVVRTTTVVKVVVKPMPDGPERAAKLANCLVNRVELRGFEPLTPTLPVWCATNCAIAPRRAGRRYTNWHSWFKTARQATSPPVSGPSGRASVCSGLVRGRVSGAKIQNTAAASRMAPLTANAEP